MADKQAMPCPSDHVAIHDKKKADLAKTEEREAVNAAITNKSLGELKLLETHSWCGDFVVECPEIVRKDQDAKFKHKERKVSQTGSKGAVVYSGVNKQGATQGNCAWLLAWQVPNSTPNSPNPQPNKVHVDCGPIDEFANIDWNSIEEKLDESPHVNYANDQTTRTEVSGSIDEKGSTAKLTSVFGLFN